MTPDTARLADGGEHNYDVVVVTRDSADCVAGCLVAAREFLGERSTRFFVVDNASRDASIEVALGAIPQAVVISNSTNVGFAAAVNQVVSRSGAEFLVLVNPDISAITGSLVELERIFEQDSTVAAVATRMVDEQGALQRSCHASLSPMGMLSESLALHERFPAWAPARRYRLLDWDMESSREVPDACGGFLLLRGSALRTVGPLDERFFLYCEETDWMLRARSSGLKVLFSPAVEVTHRSGRSSRESEETLSEYLLASQYRYVRKHFGILSEVSMRLVLGTLDVARAGLGLLPNQSSHRRESAGAAWRRLRVHVGRPWGQRD